MATRTTFDWDNPATWPPEDEPVLVYERDDYLRGIRSVHLDGDEPPFFYDEGNDLDDGIEPGDYLEWAPLNPPASDEGPQGDELLEAFLIWMHEQGIVIIDEDGDEREPAGFHGLIRDFRASTAGQG